MSMSNEARDLRNMLIALRNNKVVIFHRDPTPSTVPFGSLMRLKGSPKPRLNRTNSIWTKQDYELIAERRAQLITDGVPFFIAGPCALEALIAEGIIPDRRRKPRPTSRATREKLQHAIEDAYKAQQVTP